MLAANARLPPLIEGGQVDQAAGNDEEGEKEHNAGGEQPVARRFQRPPPRPGAVRGVGVARRDGAAGRHRWPILVREATRTPPVSALP